MLKVIIDTNLLVSAFLKKTSTSRSLIEKWKRGAFILVISEPILREIIEVLSRPRIRALTKMTKEEIGELISLIIEKALMVKPKRKIRLIKDPKDSMFLEAALVSSADYLVTGDKHLLSFKKFKKTKIIKVKEFLNLFSK